MRPQRSRTAIASAVCINNSKDQKIKQPMKANTMNEIARTNGNAQPPVTGANAFVVVGSQLGGSNLPILKTSKTGQLVSGAENTPVSETRFAADVQGAQHGFTCFVQGKVIDEIMEPVALGRNISSSELPDHGPYQVGDGWKPSASIQLRSVETGAQYIFKPVSQGGLSAIGTLLTSYGHRLAIGRGGIPIVELEVGSYNHDRYGKVFKPRFRILSWLEDPGHAAVGVGGPEDGGTGPAHGTAVKPGEELHDDEIPF